MNSSSSPLGARPVHVPVLLREVLSHLALEPGLTVVDGTVGAGGHSAHILKQIGPTGRLIGVDRDPMMLAHAAKVLTADNAQLRHASYAQLREVLADLNITQVDRVLLDLGLSSDQLADDERGFSFQSSGPLDLRFDVSRGIPAWEWLRQCSEEQLIQVLKDEGEEPFAERIAGHLCRNRRSHPVETAGDLRMAVEAALPKQIVATARKEPATRVFQALRIVVNQELQQLDDALAEVLPAIVRAGGRVVMISFHSLEDRRIKDAFRESSRWQILTPKPITAIPAEIKANPRSRSAKLRAATRL